MIDLLLKTFYWSALVVGVINLSVIGAALLFAVYVALTGNVVFI